jgi:RimJ/RimL family protein N-acetyltransferase
MELRGVASSSPRQTHERRVLLIRITGMRFEGAHFAFYAAISRGGPGWPVARRLGDFTTGSPGPPLADRIGRKSLRVSRGAGCRVKTGSVPLVRSRPVASGDQTQPQHSRPLWSNRSAQILTIMHHAKRLTREDAPHLHALRREALCAEPTAFGSSPDDCRFRELAAVEACLADPGRAVFAIADPNQPERLVAMAGIMRETRKKQQHRSSIWGVYVSQSHRGRGFGRAVVEACVHHARAWTGVESVALSVSAHGTAAKALYESLGFVTWGTEPSSLRVNGSEVAEHHMLLKLSMVRR